MKQTLATKLILLEGIPGSGKTTAGLHLQDFLEKNDFSVTFWREGNFDNPADFEGVARLSKTEYQDFVSRHPGLEKLFVEQLMVQDTDYLLWYRKLQQLHLQEIPPSLIEELSRYDVYDGLPVEDYRRLALQRWRDFLSVAESSNQITLLECCFLQNPLTVLLARHNADPQMARQHIWEIAKIIQSLNPLVIYLSPRSARNALEHVRAERPKEWADFVTWYLTEQAYGKAHQLNGYEGVIQFYERRQNLELEILGDLSMQSLVLEHAGHEWDRVDNAITGFVHSDLMLR